MIAPLNLFVVVVGWLCRPRWTVSSTVILPRSVSASHSPTHGDVVYDWRFMSGLGCRYWALRIVEVIGGGIGRPLLMPAYVHADGVGGQGREGQEGRQQQAVRAATRPYQHRQGQQAHTSTLSLCSLSYTHSLTHSLTCCPTR